MMALTLLQPWASLVAIGAKRYETRGWWTSYRGPLVITASKGFPMDCKRLAYKNEPFSSVLHAGGYTNVNSLIAVCGHALCVVDLMDCIRTQGYAPRFASHPPAEHEEAFGNYTTGRVAWITTNLRRLTSPIPVTGARGVWPLLPDTQARIESQLGARP